MRDVFESQLKTLKDDMIEMGSMIEKAIENAIRALNNRDTGLQGRQSKQIVRLTNRKRRLNRSA